MNAEQMTDAPVVEDSGEPVLGHSEFKPRMVIIPAEQSFDQALEVVKREIARQSGAIYDGQHVNISLEYHKFGSGGGERFSFQAYHAALGASYSHPTLEEAIAELAKLKEGK